MRMRLPFWLTLIILWKSNAEDDDDHEILQMEDHITLDGPVMQYGSFLDEINKMSENGNHNLIIGETQESGMLHLLNDLYTGTNEYHVEEPSSKRLKVEAELMDKFMVDSPQDLRNSDALLKLQNDYKDAEDQDSEFNSNNGGVVDPNPPGVQ